MDETFVNIDASELERILKFPFGVKIIRYNGENYAIPVQVDALKYKIDPSDKESGIHISKLNRREL